MVPCASKCWPVSFATVDSILVCSALEWQLGWSSTRRVHKAEYETLCTVFVVAFVRTLNYNQRLL